jgi:hypothetical protein
MTEKDAQTEPRDDEREQADQPEEDLAVRPGDADKVKGGAVGPCFRPK